MHVQKDGKPIRYIEVKSTTGSVNEPTSWMFRMSYNEYQQAMRSHTDKKFKNMYHVYRVFGVGGVTSVLLIEDLCWEIQQRPAGASINILIERPMAQ